MQYVIVSAKTPRRLGLVVGYRADFRNRTIYLALQAAPVTFTRGWALHGAELFINYLFSCYDFHKIYAESPEFVVESFRAELGTNFVQEGCLRENERFMGRAWDTYIFAYYRSNWEKEDSNIRRRLRIGRQRGSKVSEDGNPLTYEAFQKYLETQLSLDFQSISPETKFVDDLQFDSIRMLELLCVIEDLDVELDDNALVSINTVDEAFFHYIQSTGKRRQ